MLFLTRSPWRRRRGRLPDLREAMRKFAGVDHTPGSAEADAAFPQIWGGADAGVPLRLMHEVGFWALLPELAALVC